MTSSGTSHDSRHRATVLVVDDAASVARTATALERACVQVETHTATSAADARARLDGVDGVVSGHDAPDVDGLALLEHARERHGDLPFVLFPGGGSERVASDAIAADVTAYVRRTGDPDQYAVLAERVTEAVADGGADDDTALVGEDREQALEAEVAFLDDALGSLDDVFYVFGTDGEMTWWSDRLNEVTGYTDAEIDGMASTEFFPGSEHDRVTAYIRRIEETGHGTLETHLETKDGETTPYELYTDELTDETGQVVGQVGIARDISERKSAEWELQQQNERLEEFASILSHDLRNPLGVAQGYLGRLSIPESDDANAERIEDALDRIERIVEDVLALSRTGELVEGLAPVQFATVAEESWATVARSRATFQLDGDDRLLADRSLLERLLTNLFRNAVEHGGDAVTVRAGSLPDGFYVADDGPGIPEDVRESIFEWKHTTKAGGSGIGLRSVEQIVDVHGWDIAVTEGWDGGARFEVTGVDRPD